MNVVCHTIIQTVEDYYKLDDTLVYVKDLKHQAPKLLNEIEQLDIKMYSVNSGRRAPDKKWVNCTIFGQRAPETYQIKFSNNCVLIDYSLYDKDPDVEEWEMMKVAEEITNLVGEVKPLMTGCKIIQELLNNKGRALAVDRFNDVEQDPLNYEIICNAKKGGANHITTTELIPYETHIDYHQLYASVMINNDFPMSNTATFVNGYYKHPFAIYSIARGFAKVKEDGFPIIPSLTKTNGAAGADGNWFNLVEEVGAICDPDLTLLYKNYDVKNLEINCTIYYAASRPGEKDFGSMINKIYKGRTKAKLGAVKRFYKTLNQYSAGYFERDERRGRQWKTTQEFKVSKTTFKNPLIGIFILAYARQKLDELLTLFPHDKVVGYDTDCVFFAGVPDEVPKVVMERMGDGMGQLHFDGILENVVHVACKHYYGYDFEKGESFYKCSGMSKSGYQYRWNRDKREYELREVKKDEKR